MTPINYQLDDLFEIIQRYIPWTLFFFSSFICTLYTVQVLFSKKLKSTYSEKAYLSSSIVSSLHGVLCSVYSLKVILNDPIFLQENNFFYYTPSSFAVSQLFIGYIIYDLAVILYHGKTWPIFYSSVIHHSLAILLWTYLMLNRSGQILCVSAQICEFTTPFVNLRWILHHIGWKKTRLYMYNGFLLVFLWFTFRILLFIYIGFQLYDCRNQVIQLGLFGAIVTYSSVFLGYCLQILWFHLLLRGCFKYIKLNMLQKADKNT